MARAHLYRPIMDEEGNVQRGSLVRVQTAGTTTVLPDTLYTGPTGASARANPFTATDGVVDFWLAESKQVSLTITSPGGIATTHSYVQVGVTDPEGTEPVFISPDGSRWRVTVDNAGALVTVDADATP